MPKNANPRTWGIAESKDSRRWSSYPVGEGPNLSALVFPNNVNGNENNLPFVAIQHDDPQNDGLPMWGPGGAGVTVIRRIKVIQQPGYYAQIWYTRGDNVFDGETWGMHPYPVGGGTSTTTHNWEIAALANDYQTTRGGSALLVTKGIWYVQALRMTRNSSSSRVCTAFCNLPSTANSTIIDSPDLGTMGESGLASLPKLYIGDSPWFATFQNERFGGYLGQIKIIAKALSDADIVAEANNLDALVTADGQNNIWWGKRGFASVDDLTCDFGTARSLVWNNANKGTLGSLV